MACRERGMALVSVVILLAVLLALAHVLTEKIWQSTRYVAEAAVRERVFWAAHTGIEWSRQQLAIAYRSSAGWQNCLSMATAGAYPAEPLWTTEIDAIPVELFVRDNADGDGDLLKDNDLKVFILARARASQGAEVLVESLCGFDLAADAMHYQQLNRSTKETTGGIEGNPDLADLPVNAYRIED